MFDNTDEIIKGLQKPTWEIGDPYEVVELEVRVQELEAEKQQLIEAINKHRLEDWSSYRDKRLYSVLNKVTST